MGPWEEMNSFVSRATSGGGRSAVAVPRASSQNLGDSAYASAEEWQKRSGKPNLLKSHSDMGEDFEDRRKSKRMQLMQSIIDNVGDINCQRCDSMRERLTADRKAYYQEIEHMRRGVHKLLDTCSSFMSTGAFLKLRESLQLGVRFLTEHAEGEIDVPVPSGFDTDNRPFSPGSGKDKDAELWELQKTVGKLEDEVLRLEKENAILAKERATMTRASMARSIVSTQSTECQTDPCYMGPAHGGRAAAPGEPGWDGEEDRPGHRSSNGAPAATGPGGSRSRGGRPRAPGEPGADGDSSDDGSEPTAGPKGKSGKRKKAGLERQASKVDSELSKELARAKDELESLRRRLAERDKELAEERRKAVVTAEAAKEQVRVEVITVPGKSKDKPGAVAGGRSQIAASGSEEEKAKRGQRGGGLTPSKERVLIEMEFEGAGPGLLADPGGTRPKTPGGRRTSALAGSPSASKSSVGRRMVDKCVGTTDVPPPSPPPRVRGRSICATVPEPALNKTGMCFQRNIRSEPSLSGALGSSSLGGTSTGEATAASALAAAAAVHKGGTAPCAYPARSKPKPVLSATAPPGGDLWSGSSKFSTDTLASTVTQHFGSVFSDGSLATQTWREAEPYLLQVWETRPEGHKKPSRKELMNLGALTPSPPLF